MKSPANAGAEPVHHAGEILDNPNRLIDIEELGHFLGCGKTKIYADLATPDSSIPRPVKHGRSTRWVLGEVLAYIKSLVDERDTVRTSVPQ